MKLRIAAAFVLKDGMIYNTEDDLLHVLAGQYSHVESRPRASSVIDLHYALEAIKSLVFVKAKDANDYKWSSSSAREGVQMWIRCASDTGKFSTQNPGEDQNDLNLGKALIMDPIMSHDNLTTVRVDCPHYKGKWYDIRSDVDALESSRKRWAEHHGGVPPHLE